MITPGVDPTALVQSLGPLPFPGAGVAPHYFQAVYERAAGLAVALAAAAGLLDLSAPSTDHDDADADDARPRLPARKGSDLHAGVEPRSLPFKGARMTEVVTPPSFVGGLGVELWTDDDRAHARCEILPSFLKPGTDRVRMGVLATLVDMVAGSPAHAVINPTVDLPRLAARPRAVERPHRARVLPGEDRPTPVRR